MRKKIFILYPPISKLERYSSRLGSVGGEQLPLGIYYLSSFMRANGYEVSVCDAEAEKLRSEDIVERIGKYSPRFVGISSTTVAFHRAVEVADAIKVRFPDVTIVLGGPHATSNVEHAMSFKSFDYCVMGEGEITLLELLDAVSRNGSLTEIRGVAYRNGAGEIVRNHPREYIGNLDVLPYPAYDLVKDINAYAPPPSNYRTIPVMNIITSRGCPNKCTFCDRSVFGIQYRERSAANVFGEIKYLHEAFGIRELAFVDDTFLISKSRVRELFAMIRNAGLFFPWTCMARINNVTHDFLKYLKENGCWSIAFGIESGDEKILNNIKKNILIEKVIEVIQWCDGLGIETKGFFIIGHPGETLQTINKTIDFAVSLKLSAVVVTINTPIPGSLQYEEAGKYGSLDTTDWAQFSYWRPVFVPFGLTKELLLKKQEEFYLRFYLRPRIVWKYIRGFFGKGGLRRFSSVMNIFLSHESIGKVMRYLIGGRKARVDDRSAISSSTD